MTKLSNTFIWTPYGMVMPGKHGSAGSSYRYGFQGQEKDDEVKGQPGNSINYKYRMHDPRVGRFFAVDPLAGKYVHYSPYSFSGNKVIHRVEIEGLEDGQVSLECKDPNLQNASYEGIEAYRHGQNQALMWSAIVALDLTITRGRITTFMLEQYVQGAVYSYGKSVFTGESTEDALVEALESIDVFDATVEALLGSGPKDQLVGNFLSSVVDVGVDGSTSSVVDGSKSNDKIFVDLVLNVANDKVGFANASYGEVGEELIQLGEQGLVDLLDQYTANDIVVNISYQLEFTYQGETEELEWMTPNWGNSGPPSSNGQSSATQSTESSMPSGGANATPPSSNMPWQNSSIWNTNSSNDEN